MGSKSDKMDDSDDQDVILAVLDGDNEAFGVLVVRYQRPIFNLAYRLTKSHSDAVDLAQETFLKAFEELHRFRKGRRFFPWIYTIAMNLGRNFLRRSRQWQNESIEDHECCCEPHTLHHNEEKLCRQMDSRRIQEALHCLPLDYREALILRYQEDCSMEDIATALQLSVSGAKMRVMRGLGRLREIVGSQDLDRYHDGREKN